MLWYILALPSWMPTPFTAHHPELKNSITSTWQVFLTELQKRFAKLHMRSWLEGCPQVQTLIMNQWEGMRWPKTQLSHRKKQTGQTKDNKISDPSNEARKIGSRCGKCNVHVNGDYSQIQVVCHNSIQRGDKTRKERGRFCFTHMHILSLSHTHAHKMNVDIVLLVLCNFFFPNFVNVFKMLKVLKKWKILNI